MSRRLAPLLALAKLLLGDRSPDLGRAATAERRSYAVVWDMNVLFEEYVGRVCQDVFEPKGLDVDLQEAAKWKRLDPRSAALGRPGLQRDFVIQGGGALRVVVRVMTVDLARLESVPGLVGENLCVS